MRHVISRPCLADERLDPALAVQRDARERQRDALEQRPRERERLRAARRADEPEQRLRGGNMEKDGKKME